MGFIEFIIMHPFQCPHCRGVFQILPDFAGQAVACPHCTGAILIPSAVADPPLQPSAIPPPVAAPPSTLPGVVPPPPGQPAVPNAPPVAEPRSTGEFVRPAVDGAPDLVVRDLEKAATLMSPRPALRELSSAERSTRRAIKNAIVFGLGASGLMALMWWLLR